MDEDYDKRIEKLERDIAEMRNIIVLMHEEIKELRNHDCLSRSERATLALHTPIGGVYNG